MRNLKIAFSILFVLAVAFFVVRACVYQKPSVKHPVKRVSAVPVKKVPKAKEKLSVQAPGVREAKMAIILDDWGNSTRLMKYFDEIDRPVTLSILPHLPFSKKIAESAESRGLGVMLHMPMQPKGTRAKLEPHTVLTAMSDAQISSHLVSALESVPGAEGVNNHQGSAATSDLRVMKIVLGELKKRNLFFIDSHVASTTVGPRVAKELGLRFAKRDVFIDNEMTAESIKKQLDRAKGIAQRRGQVVVMGHDRELTLKVIKEVVPEFEKRGIKFVLVRELI